MSHGGARPNTGGPRPGSGRPKAQTTVKTREIADRIAVDGEPAPLNILVSHMRTLWASKDLDDKKAACAIARDAAPYLHPRLQPVPAGDVRIDLPDLATAQGVAAATSRVIEAMVIAPGCSGTVRDIKPSTDCP